MAPAAHPAAPAATPDAFCPSTSRKARFLTVAVAGRLPDRAAPRRPGRRAAILWISLPLCDAALLTQNGNSRCLNIPKRAARAARHRSDAGRIEGIDDADQKNSSTCWNFIQTASKRERGAPSFDEMKGCAGPAGSNSGIHRTDHALRGTRLHPAAGAFAPGAPRNLQAARQPGGKAVHPPGDEGRPPGHTPARPPAGRHTGARFELR